jgi:hypothetical protein
MIRLLIVLVLCGFSSWEYGRLQYAKGYFSGVQTTSDKYQYAISTYQHATDSLEKSVHTCTTGWTKSSDSLDEAFRIIELLKRRINHHG